MAPNGLCKDSTLAQKFLVDHQLPVLLCVQYSWISITDSACSSTYLQLLSWLWPWLALMDSASARFLCMTLACSWLCSCSCSSWLIYFVWPWHWIRTMSSAPDLLLRSVCTSKVSPDPLSSLSGSAFIRCLITTHHQATTGLATHAALGAAPPVTTFRGSGVLCTQLQGELSHHFGFRTGMWQTARSWY